MNNKKKTFERRQRSLEDVEVSKCTFKPYLVAKPYAAPKPVQKPPTNETKQVEISLTPLYSCESVKNLEQNQHEQVGSQLPKHMLSIEKLLGSSQFKSFL